MEYCSIEPCQVELGTHGRRCWIQVIIQNTQQNTKKEHGLLDCLIQQVMRLKRQLQLLREIIIDWETLYL